MIRKERRRRTEGDVCSLMKKCITQQWFFIFHRYCVHSLVPTFSFQSPTKNIHPRPYTITPLHIFCLSFFWVFLFLFFAWKSVSVKCEDVKKGEKQQRSSWIIGKCLFGQVANNTDFWASKQEKYYLVFSTLPFFPQFFSSFLPLFSAVGRDQGILIFLFIPFILLQLMKQSKIRRKMMTLLIFHNGRSYAFSLLAISPTRWKFRNFSYSWAELLAKVSSFLYSCHVYLWINRKGTIYLRLMKAFSPLAMHMLLDVMHFRVARNYP